MSETQYDIVKALDKIGLAKCCMSLRNMLILAIFAGVYIGFGGALSLIVTHDMSSYLGIGFSKLIAGIVFSVGLMLVVLGGAELFTGNNLLIIPCMDRKITPFHLIKNLSVVYLGNFAGSLLLVLIFVGTGLWKVNNNLIAFNILSTANSKVNLSFLEAFCRGILCNWLVCLAIWMATSAKSTSGKILSILFPIMAFVSSGFEHCIANMFFIPLGLWLKEINSLADVSSALDLTNLTWGNFFYRNLLPVTLGNILGGLIFVGFLYWFVYRTKDTICGDSLEQTDVLDTRKIDDGLQQISNDLQSRINENILEHRKKVKETSKRGKRNKKTDAE